MQSLLLLLGLAPLVAVGVLLRQRTAEPVFASCGKAPSFPNARPKNFEDSKTEEWNATAGKMKPKIYAAGAKIEFECLPGFSLNGSKDGDSVFEASCGDYGYFKPEGTCVEASKCGPLPSISHAKPTGKVSKATGKTVVEFTCQAGYSLDGEKVVAGGLGKNQLFTLECIEFSGAYSEFAGECQAADFVPAKKSTMIYTKVFEALFHVSCKGALKKQYAKGDPPKVDSVCDKVKAAEAASECGQIVSKIKADFQSQYAKREEDKSKKEWFNNTAITGINDESDEFCKKLWTLVKMPED